MQSPTCAKPTPPLEDKGGRYLQRCPNDSPTTRCLSLPWNGFAPQLYLAAIGIDADELHQS
jgi:hypothetical protein